MTPPPALGVLGPWGSEEPDEESGVGWGQPCRGATTGPVSRAHTSLPVAAEAPQQAVGEEEGRGGVHVGGTSRLRGMGGRLGCC